MSRYRLSFTVDLVREHEVPDEFAAGDKALELHAAFADAMAAVPRSGVLLGAVDVRLAAARTWHPIWHRTTDSCHN